MTKSNFYKDQAIKDSVNLCLYHFDEINRIRNNYGLPDITCPQHQLQWLGGKTRALFIVNKLKTGNTKPLLDRVKKEVQRVECTRQKRREVKVNKDQCRSRIGEIENALKAEIKMLRSHTTNTQISFKPGYVYAVTNPAFPGWIKIGSALDVYGRLATYQTSDPFASFKIEAYILVDDRVKVEHSVQKELTISPHRGEWFQVGLEKVKEIFAEYENSC